MVTEEQLKQKFKEILPYLDEKQRRLLAAVEARTLGRGGISRVSKATGMSRVTINKAMNETKYSDIARDRIRKKGGGRKTLYNHDPSLVEKLESLVNPTTRGDPMSPLRWTCKSTRKLAKELSEQGYKVSYGTVANLLHQLNYSLQANVKTLEGKGHPDRDTQFEYINKHVQLLLKRKQPVISVDTKKKELIGEYKNSGREWQPKGIPEKVQVHDFPNPELGKAIPYGIYDVGENVGWVNVGCDHDTSSFAVASIRQWWLGMGKELYSKAKELLICADSGGSNGYRVRLWKIELQKLSSETGLKMTVCHLPPGTSKWNKIEHRLFSHISMNWRGHPLTSYEVVVNLIGSTTTKTGLNVKATLDRGKYPTKIKISDIEMEKLKLKRHEFHGEWNYTFVP